MFLLHWFVPQDDLDLDDNKVIVLVVYCSQFI